MKKNAIKGLRALSPNDLITRYRDGERDFNCCNLLRQELESVTAGMQYFSCLEHPDLEKYNALWVDFRCGIPGEQDFEWDSDGRCLSLVTDDAPTRRDLRSAQLAFIRLAGSYLYPVDFSGVKLTSADLRRAIFIDCDFTGANLARSDLRDTQFDNCTLRNVDFYMARMDRLRFVDCDARGSSFHRAKLYRARFIRADLRGTTLRQAHCERLNLIESDIRGVDLSSVTLPASRVWGSLISKRQANALLAALEVRVERKVGGRPTRQMQQRANRCG